jgi:hypothetical protein
VDEHGFAREHEGVVCDLRTGLVRDVAEPDAAPECFHQLAPPLAREGGCVASRQVGALRDDVRRAVEPVLERPRVGRVHDERRAAPVDGGGQLEVAQARVGAHARVPAPRVPVSFGGVRDVVYDQPSARPTDSLQSSARAGSCT